MITTKPMKKESKFSLVSVLRRSSIIIDPQRMPAIDKASISQRSGLEASKIRLSKHAKRKRKKSVNQANIQYLVTTFLRMIVNDTPERIQISALKTKGGSTKANWRTFKTMTNADKTGYFST